MTLIPGRVVMILASILIIVSGGPFKDTAMGADVKKKAARGSRCASMKKKDINDILGKLKVPEAADVSISASPLQGICEAVVDDRGRTAVFYLDTSKRYIFLHGSLVDVTKMTNLTSDKMQKLKDRRRIDLAQIPLNENLVVGELAASKKVIIFTDPDCDYCAQLHKTILGITAKRKDVAFYYKFLPLDFHKDAYWKAKTVVCNKSIKMLEENFTSKTIQKTDCQTDEVDNSIKLARALGIKATPTIILPDGRIREGALPEDELLNLIDRRNEHGK
jgi:thiol:disulfide interchange protein DsbC